MVGGGAGGWRLFEEDASALGWGCSVAEAEAADADFADEGGGFFGGVGEDKAVEVFGVDGSHGNEAVEEEIHEGLVVFDAHEDAGVVADLSGLDEGCDFEKFVEGAESAGEGDERIGVLGEHDFPHEEVTEFDEGIEVGVGLLFVGQLDVATDGVAADVFCAAIGGFHEAGPAASHDSEAFAGDGLADAAAEVVVGVVLGESGGAEDGDAGADEVEFAESADEFAADAEDAEELGAPVGGTFEELAFICSVGCLPPFGGAGGGEGEGARVFGHEGSLSGRSIVGCGGKFGGSRGFPTEVLAAAVERHDVEGRRGARLRELHAIPGVEGWLLIAAGSERPLGEFREIGALLDAALERGGLVRLVVHERKAS